MNNNILDNCQYRTIIPGGELPENERREHFKQLAERLAASGITSASVSKNVASFRLLSLPEVLKILRPFFLVSFPHLLPPKHSSGPEVDKICGRVLLCLMTMRQTYLEGLHGRHVPNATTFGLIMVHKKDLGKVARGPKVPGGCVPRLLAQFTDTKHTRVELPSAATVPGSNLLVWQQKDAFITEFEINDPDEPLNNPSCWFLCATDEKRFCGEFLTTPVLERWLMDQVICSPREETFRVLVSTAGGSKPRPKRQDPAPSKLTRGTFDQLEYENMRITEGRCCECNELLPDRRLKCSRCLRAQYCGKECQLKHWKTHQAACAKKS